MKYSCLFLFLLTLSGVSYSQTLYLPSDSIGLSTNNNIGIGVTNPQDKLHVEGNLSIKAGGATTPSFLDFTRTSDGWKAAKITQAYGKNGFAGHLSNCLFIKTTSN